MLAAQAVAKLRTFKKGVVDYHVNGSCAINGSGNDVDVVVLLESLEFGEFSGTYTHLVEESYASDGDFDSYRDGVINFIFTDNKEYYIRWLSAREVCRHMAPHYGFNTREFRVQMFRIIVDQEVSNAS